MLSIPFRTIEQHAECLVRLLETCLGYNLRPVNGGTDPPHAKFASDVMPCIFLVLVSFCKYYYLTHILGHWPQLLELLWQFLVVGYK